MKRIKRKRCRNCCELFTPDYRNINRQHYCRKVACRKASKKASQKKWLSKPENEDYFRSTENVKRVQEWRRGNPGYWKRAKKGNALQDPLNLQDTENTEDNDDFTKDALQDFLRTQPPVIIGLIANFTGNTLQDDIASTLLYMQRYGQDILYPQHQSKGGKHDCKITGFQESGTQGTQKFQLDRSSSGTRSLY
ncbi:MAG TPA: hypothetical protein ENJ60_03860 [Aeromonadales bacterium]|nr:hypothetical protein [Aeromonadales bacterium]